MNTDELTDPEAIFPFLLFYFFIRDFIGKRVSKSQNLSKQQVPSFMAFSLEEGFRGKQ
ncbi:MAG: hypothetical protein PHT58_02025 [Eubacteriales bacterium]|nr:hypothetical protein [Eubacteriales bacterium]